MWWSCCYRVKACVILRIWLFLYFQCWKMVGTSWSNLITLGCILLSVIAVFSAVAYANIARIIALKIGSSQKIYPNTVGVSRWQKKVQLAYFYFIRFNSSRSSSSIKFLCWQDISCKLFQSFTTGKFDQRAAFFMLYRGMENLIRWRLSFHSFYKTNFNNNRLIFFSFFKLLKVLYFSAVRRWYDFCFRKPFNFVFICSLCCLVWVWVCLSGVKSRWLWKIAEQWKVDLRKKAVKARIKCKITSKFNTYI